MCLLDFKKISIRLITYWTQNLKLINELDTKSKVLRFISNSLVHNRLILFKTQYESLRTKLIIYLWGIVIMIRLMLDARIDVNVTTVKMSMGREKVWCSWILSFSISIDTICTVIKSFYRIWFRELHLKCWVNLVTIGWS